MKKAQHYINKNDDQVLCLLCPHNCVIDEGEFGHCKVRQNVNGTLYSHVYENAAAVHMDPIEKKPLFHVYPGSQTLSLATVGCNFSCAFCQNHDIAQIQQDPQTITGQHFSPQDIVNVAKLKKCKTISSTYTEPTIYFEYAYDIARLAHEQGIGTNWVSNGFINTKPLKEITQFLSAINIDIKGWDDDFYSNIIGGERKPVLQAAKNFKKAGVWVEITTLVIPGHVDNSATLESIAKFIKNELGPETPWHISRFHPQHKFSDYPFTSIEALQNAYDIGKKAGLHYVYCGNVPGHEFESTFCHNCGKVLIKRLGYQIVQNHLKATRCHACDTQCAGIF